MRMRVRIRWGALGVVFADVSQAHRMVMVVGVNELAKADGGILKEL